MIVQCPECQSRYSYDDERFERKPSRNLRCFRCKAVFEVTNPAWATPGQVTDPEQTGAHRRLEVLEREQEDEEVSKEPRRRRKKREKSEEPSADSVKPQGPPMLPAGLRFSLAVISGPDSGTVYRIEKPETLIGRAHGDLSLTDSETSRSHASVVIYETGVLLKDLESTNGTFHKSKAVSAPVLLHNQSEFQVGNTTLMLIITRE